MTIAALLIAGFLVILALLVWRAWAGWEHAERIEGWWHQRRSAGQRWQPAAWEDACQASLRKSRERR